MSYVHCRNCTWTQDDFWEVDGYTPLRADFAEHLRESLFKDAIPFDPVFFKERGIAPDGHDGTFPTISGKRYVAHELRRIAENIEGQFYRTHQECKEAGFKCPDCGGSLTHD